MRRALTVIATLTFAAPAAHATGLCENTSSSYSLAAVSVQARQVLVEGEIEWCEETDDGERRGTIRIAQLRAFDGKVLSWYADPLEGAAKRLGAKVQSMEELQKLRSSRGFVPVATLRGPRGGCEAKLLVGAVRGEGAQQSAPVSIELRAGGKAVHTKELRKNVATDPGGQFEALFLPGTGALLWWALPWCDGGPPAGHFGEDDPGECYVKWDTGLELVPPVGALATCFPAELAPSPAPAPGATPPKSP